MGAVENIDPVLGTRPELTQSVEAKEIDQALCARALDAFVDGELSRVQADVVDAAAEAITDPECSIGSGAKRQNFLVREAAGTAEPQPLAIAERK